MIALAWMLLACGGDESVAEAERFRPNAEALRVEVARMGPSTQATLKLTLPGEVEGSEDVLLSSALGGQVEAVLVQKGDPVRRGQLIARVDAEIYAAQAAQADAQLLQSQTEFARLEKMGDLSSASQRTQAETGVKIAQAQADGAHAQLGRAYIRAPFAGVAADVFPGRGEFLGPGSPVARIVKLDPITVALSVADRDVVGLRQGMEVEVSTAALGHPIPGRIAHVGRAANLRTRSFPVDVELANPEHLLLPGMIASVNLERSLSPDILAIPQDWIVTRRSGQGVFIEVDGFAKWTPVELGEVLHDQVVVNGGLSREARVVITGHRDLVDGDAVLVAREGLCCVEGRPRFGGE